MEISGNPRVQIYLIQLEGNLVNRQKNRGSVVPAIVATTAVSLLATLLGPAQATAAPVATTVQAATTPQAAAAPESTLEDKVRAAAVLGVVAGDDLLVLNDHNFVIALWRIAKGTEVRASAELAFAGTIADATRWIKTGIQQANDRDVAKETRDAAIAQAARELKQRAAAVIGIAAEPELLIQSNKDFIFALWQRATGPKVKNAALNAFGGTDVAQVEFLQTGIFTAHAQDQQDKIDADHNASEAEKARLAARDAKSRAAAVLGIIATENLLVLTDDNFVREIWNRATVGTEVSAAAERALRSSAPADWKAFIDTGIYDANKRDLAIALQKKTDADRRRGLEIQTQAESSGVHPRLAAAARAALAGTADDVDLFLRLGQYDVLTQSLQAVGAGVRGSFLANDNGNAALTTGQFTFGQHTPIADVAWTITPGLADPACFSLEWVGHPGVYVRHKDFQATVAPSDGSAAFRADATWCAKKNQTSSDITLEAKSLPGRFLRSYAGQLFAANTSGEHQFDTEEDFGQDTLWRADTVAPEALSPVALRWLNDDAIRAQVGNPSGAEQSDGPAFYQKYERGALYWNAESGVYNIGNEILAAFLRLGGNTSRYKYPIRDVFLTNNNNYCAWFKIGSISYSPSTGEAFDFPLKCIAG